MAPKNPLGTIKDVADLAVASVAGTVSRTVKDPVGTGKKVVGTAVGQAAAAVGAVTSKVGGRKGSKSQPRCAAETDGAGAASGAAREEGSGEEGTDEEDCCKEDRGQEGPRQEAPPSRRPPPRKPPPRRPLAEGRPRPRPRARAEMDPRTILTRGVSTGLRLGRGTADRVVTIAGPPLGRLSDKMVSRMRRPERRSPATFTPSKRNDAATAEPEPHREAAPHQRPWPATSARLDRPRSPPGRQAEERPRSEAATSARQHVQSPSSAIVGV